MNFFERMTKIDRRIIYILLAIVVIIPFFIKIQMPIRAMGPVKSAYNAINSLEPGSTILVSMDFDPASMPELRPMATAILRHAFSKKIKVLMTGHWYTGVPLAKLILEDVATEYHAKYGVDYVNLGYRPGVSAVILGIGREIRDIFREDYAGNPLDSLPMMRNIHNYNDIALLVALEAGATGDFWVQYAWARYGVKIILGMTAVSAPDAYPYLQTKQIIGLIGGLKGAAAYESLVHRRGVASVGMPAQSYAHILIIIFIILGNIGYFLSRKKKG
jgi:hypothetical protein